MHNLINTKNIFSSYVKTLTESEDPIKRRDALMVITFFIDKECNRWSYNDDARCINHYDENDNKIGKLSELVKSALLHDPDAEVRMYAAWAIGFLRREDANDEDAETLVQGLNDEDFRVRLEAVQTLGYLEQFEDFDGVTGLFKALTDENLVVRMYALLNLIDTDTDYIQDRIIYLLFFKEDNNDQILND